MQRENFENVRAPRAGTAILGPGRVVYVDPVRGDDKHDGLTRGGAKLTITAGLALLREGYPDCLELLPRSQPAEPAPLTRGPTFFVQEGGGA